MATVTVSQSASAPIQASRYLLAIPGLIVGVGIGIFGVVAAWVTPHSARVWYDPSMQYFGTSLGLFRGIGYSYVDHPGTPVEIIGTAVVGVSYPVLRAVRQGLIAHYVNHPQHFMSACQTLIVIASIGVAYLLARHSVVVANWENAFIGGAVASLFFITLPHGQYAMQPDGGQLGDAFRSISMWSHESFTFPAGTGLSLAVLMAVRRANTPSWRAVLGLGVATGVLTSIQLYFAAWVIGTAVALAVAARLSGLTWRQVSMRALAVPAAAGIGFVLSTLPIYNHYYELISWVWAIISHTGSYGTGEAGIPSLTVMASSLLRLVSFAQTLFIACTLGIVALAWQLWLTHARPRMHRALWAAGIGFLVQLLVVLALVGKHPDPRYLLPVGATLPLLIAATLDSPAMWPKLRQQVAAAIGIACLVVFGFATQSATTLYAAEDSWIQHMDEMTHIELSRIAQAKHIAPEALRVLWTYGTNSPCFGLFIADEAAARAFKTELTSICPRDSIVYPNRTIARTATGAVELAQYQDWDVLVLTDSPISDVYRNLRLPATTYRMSSVETLRGLGSLAFIVRN